MRSDKEILIAIRNRYDKGISGLCATCYILYKEDGVLTRNEFLRFDQIWSDYAKTKNNFYHYHLGEVLRTKSRVMTYGWRPHTETKRLEWIDGEIKILK